jgi:2-haloacid dehalogenase
VTAADVGGRDVGAVFFDLFGTLLPLGPLDDACDQLAAGRGREIATRWRARQIEAAWLRTIMGRWADFDAITLDALATTLQELEVRADDAAVADAAGAFARLPIDPVAADVIRNLREAELAVGILTNASRPTVDAVVARLEVSFDHVLSVDAVRRFKPDRAVYDLAVRATGLTPDRIGFVTGNGWDAVGAAAFGFRVAWLASAAAAVLPPVDAPAVMRLTWSEIHAAFAGGVTKPRNS